jgi:O-antigen ligase
LFEEDRILEHRGYILALSHNRLLRATIVKGRSVGSSSTEVTRRIIAGSRLNIPSVVQLSFLLFVFSLPFEGLDVGLSGSKAGTTGLLFFGLYVYYYRPFSHGRRSFAPIPRAAWWYIGYVAVYAINGLLIPADAAQEFVTRLFTLVQLVVFFWIASSLLEDQQMARSILLTYVIAHSILALGILGVPGFSEETQGVIDGGRQTGLGHNPNSLATMMALTTLMVIGLFLNSSMHSVKRWMLLALALPPLVMMVKTGSRAGVGAFALGCVVYLLPFLRQRRKLVAISLAILGVFAVGYMVASNPDFVERVELATEGDLATREDLYPAAMEMFLERPVLGWQPVEFTYELGGRVNAKSGRRDTHNLFLWLLVEVGLLGTIPFLSWLWLCMRASWNARKSHLGLLPLSILLSILAANMTHTYLLVDKGQLLMLALAVASGATVTKKQKSYGSLPVDVLRSKARAKRVLSQT